MRPSTTHVDETEPDSDGKPGLSAKYTFERLARRRQSTEPPLLGQYNTYYCSESPEPRPATPFHSVTSPNPSVQQDTLFEVDHDLDVDMNIWPKNK
jgi:hypothetical protein